MKLITIAGWYIIRVQKTVFAPIARWCFFKINTVKPKIFEVEKFHEFGGSEHGR